MRIWILGGRSITIKWCQCKRGKKVVFFLLIDELWLFTCDNRVHRWPISQTWTSCGVFTSDDEEEIGAMFTKQTVSRIKQKSTEIRSRKLTAARLRFMSSARPATEDWGWRMVGVFYKVPGTRTTPSTFHSRPDRPLPAWDHWMIGWTLIKTTPHTASVRPDTPIHLRDSLTQVKQ